jgi:hypothetical protein
MSKDLVNIIKTRKFVVASALAGLIIGGGNLMSMLMFLTLDKTLGNQKIYDYLDSSSMATPSPQAAIYLTVASLLVFASFVLGVVLYIVAYRVVFAKLGGKQLFNEPKLLAKVVVLAYVVGNAVLGYGITYTAYYLFKYQFGDKPLDQSNSASVVIGNAAIDFVLIPLLIYYFAKKRAEKRGQELFS